MNIVRRRPTEATDAVDLAEQLQTRLLRHRLKRIDELLGDLPEVKDDGTERSQGVRKLRSLLLGEKRVVEAALSAPQPPPDLTKRAANEALLDREERMRRETTGENIRRLWDEREYVQWHKAMMEQLNLRSVICREFNIRY